MKAIFLFDASAPSYFRRRERLLEHLKQSTDEMACLYIKTKNRLYKSNAPNRTSHIMTLEPIPLSEVVKWESVLGDT
jgi:hypothetical protein